ncbi:MAG TPA: radical SAM protein [Methanobacteriales archaeon]|nr:MAG: Radical SAM domain protein [Methanobacteriaceae archaeon 41_258]HIH61718.1 radical SAM protein [Methanobacteriales archaeon]
MKDFKNCKLCEWRCGVNRLEGETGICHVELPEVAYTSLAYILKSYSITFLGCSFKCLYCNAYRISQYPDTGWIYRGYIEPEKMAKEAFDHLESPLAKNIGAYRLSFTGGEPTIHTPYLEELVRIIRKFKPSIEVGIATNGFPTVKTLKRLLKIVNFINFEIKAFNDETHRNLTGAPSEPVLRNAAYLAEKVPEKIRVFRTVVIPGITDREVPMIAEFLSEINEEIPYRLIGFRPNFVLYYHRGPSKTLMDDLVKKCKENGLKNVDYSGYYPLKIKDPVYYLEKLGCPPPRNCGECKFKNECRITLMEPWLFK